MQKAIVVIGSAYGDEGKGLMTDYFASHFEHSLVVRFNGGAQAGHTVTTLEQRHVFGHVCSNALLGKNHQSYLSEYFVLNPLLLRKELIALSEKKIYPVIYANPNCLVSTPFDMIINQLLEKKRAKDKHGSCGVGFGETIERSENKAFILHAKDFNTKQGWSILEKIQQDYFPQRIQSLGLNEELKDYPFILTTEFLHQFYEDAKNILKEIKLCSLDTAYGNNHDKGLIFEGAQGLLLDQELGFFPYVTRSYTGLKNVMAILPKTVKHLDVIYASRCYTTRHGAGPLVDELSQKPYNNIIDNTNIPNEYQDALRYSYLNLDILKETINRDLKRIDTKGLIMNINYAITCLDQAEEIVFTHENQQYQMKSVVFCSWLSECFKKDVWSSWGTTRETIKKIPFENRCLLNCA